MAKRVPDRRGDILAATLKQVAERGMAAFRVQDVAHALGVSSALIHYHFDSKEELVAAAFEYFAQADLAKIETLRQAGGTEHERLARILVELGPSAPIWIEAWSVALREPRIRESVRRVDQQWCSVTEAIIVQGVASGEFVCASPADTARRLISLLDGLSVARTVYDAVSRPRLNELLLSVAAAELGTTPFRLAASVL